MIVNNLKLIDILKLSAEYLQEKNIENPRLNAELLIGYVLNLNRVQLYLNHEKPLAMIELEKIREVLKRRALHEPVQYIVGKTEFYSLKFIVNRHTLIPRPETEILVEKIISECQKNFTGASMVNILDIGTGCGNIAITIAKHVPLSKITAIDVLRETLAVAAENARINNVAEQVNFIKANIFDMNSMQKLPGKFDIIVSNPPYISQESLDKLPAEIRNYEPYIALNGGESGLKFYHHVFHISRNLIHEHGVIGMEIGYDQADQVKRIATNYGYTNIEILNDLNDRQRVIIAK